MSSQASGEARQAAGHDPYDLYGALRKVETTNLDCFEQCIHDCKVKNSFQLFVQWVWRRLSRRCSCWVWPSLHPGSLWSGLWYPLHGLDYPAWTRKEEERCGPCWRGRRGSMWGLHHPGFLWMSHDPVYEVCRGGKCLVSTGRLDVAWWVGDMTWRWNDESHNHGETVHNQLLIGHGFK